MEGSMSGAVTIVQGIGESSVRECRIVLTVSALPNYSSWMSTGFHGKVCVSVVYRSHAVYFAFYRVNTSRVS
ncbi:hypothetical protein ANCDUO_24697 [Ancylostoma duodenale]|uniref:Uncharacterized protein n=1 Tax=Ancylostoma duodenale TaxID=51022 RepID=A0A0C2F9Y8_9BILA|nr:hypothetical protein ANCDUO_24697 [Ancylostoma duodenale]